MPTFGPIKRKDLIYYLRQLGFQGPFVSKRHEFMRKERLKVFVPNPHEGDIGRSLLAKILKQAKVEQSAWEKL